MRPANQVRLWPGRVYRTRALLHWSANASRLADRLVHEGRLQRLSHGLFYAPRRTRFGSAAPDEFELLRAFLDDGDFVLTGSEAWNALGLGTTAVLPLRVVYNRKRSGEFNLGGQRFLLRRVAFPSHPGPEWYVVDLLENLTLANADASMVEGNLARALAVNKFDLSALRAAADRYGTQRTRDLVERAARHAVAA